MALDNVSRLASKGMLDSDQLTDSEQKFLNDLTREEADQLVAMWERLGKPKMPSGGGVVGFF